MLKHLGRTSLTHLISKIKGGLSAKEDTANKITVLSAENTDIQYPSAKAVNNKIDSVVGDISTLLDSL